MMHDHYEAGLISRFAFTIHKTSTGNIKACSFSKFQNDKKHEIKHVSLVFS